MSEALVDKAPYVAFDVCWNAWFVMQRHDSGATSLALAGPFKTEDEARAAVDTLPNPR